MLGNLEETNTANAPLLSAFSDDQIRNNSVDFDFICKTIIVGDSAVGKSSLFQRFSSDTFSESHVTTESVEFGFRFIDTLNSRCKVQVWDCVTSASSAIMNSVYKGSNAIILLFDVTNRDSFDSVEDWLLEIRQYAENDVMVYIVGTKIDLPNRAVSQAEGKDLAERLGVDYWELSSKTSDNVDGLFFKIVANQQDKDQSLLSSSIDNSSRYASTLSASGADVRASFIDRKDDNQSIFPCCIIS